MIARLWRWLWRWLNTSPDDNYLPKSWLANKARIGNYVGYTRRQHQQGSVVTHAADMAERARHAAFWSDQEAKRTKQSGTGYLRKVK